MNISGIQPGIPDWQEYCLVPANAGGGNTVRLLRNGEQAFPAMLDAINSARKLILLEMYSIYEDLVGQKFRAALEAAAKRGVKVFLIYDAIGSFETRRAFFDHMKEAGIRILEFHPFVPWKPHWKWFRRDHRKVLVIDNETGFTGGINITDEYGPRAWNCRDWRDTAVMFRGPCVKEVAASFWTNWIKCGMPHDSEAIAMPYPEPNGNTPVTVTSVTGMMDRRSPGRNYKFAISKAKDYIYITNAYFLPGRAIYRSLIKAAKWHGVEVKILTPSQPDNPIVRWASWPLIVKLLKAGVEVYEWQPGGLHAKTSVIDGLWSSVGSLNMDRWSFKYNLELNLNIHNREFGEKMRAMFEDDLKHARKITLEDWTSQSLLFRISSRILHLFRVFL